MQKRTVFIGIVIGLVFGLFVGGAAFKIAAPTMLFKEVRSPYGFDKTVSLIRDRINRQEDWHVTTIIDQQDEIIKYGGEDVGRVKIIKFCNGILSGEMLSDDATRSMAVKMPLSIAVYEKSDGRVMLGLMNGYLMARLFSGRREGGIMERVVRDMESILGFLHFRYTIF